MWLRALNPVLRDENKDDGSDAGGTGDDKTGDEQQLQPGPGETVDSVSGLKAVKGDDDKGDDVDDKGKEGDDKGKEGDDKGKEGDDKDKEGDDKSNEKSVPKWRLDAALARARDAEARAAAAEAAKNPPKSGDTTDDDDDVMTIAQAEKRLEDLDNEIAKAMKNEEDEDGSQLAALLREQRELQQGIYEARQEDARSEQSQMTAEEIQFDKVVDQLEADIPKLNPNNKEEYDKELTDEVVSLANALAAQGRTQGDALLMAVDYMSEKLGLSDDDKTTDKIRKDTDVEKNVQTAKNMPPDTPGATGTASDKAGISADNKQTGRMSEKEFEVLATQNPEELARLRGDHVDQ